MIVQKTEVTSRVRFHAISVFILLLMMVGCDSITSPDATTDFQSRNIQKNSQSNSAGHLNPDFSDQADRPHLIEGHYIVVLSGETGKKNPRAAAALEALAKEVGQKPGAKINRTYKNVITGFAAELTDEQVEDLRRDPRVLAIEQDHYVYLDNVGTVQEHPAWGLDRIDQRESLLDRAYAYTATGQGVNAYIMDTGIRYSHEEFGGRASLGYDFVLEDEPENTDLTQEPGEDCMGHGTPVAGLLGGSTHGVAKNVNLISVRVGGCTGGLPVSRAIAAIDWITENAAHPAVVNMSFGYNYNEITAFIDIAIENSIETGVHYVTSAGNSNIDACLMGPAQSSGVLTVGAIQIGDRRASFSNYGECVDLYAPAVGTETASHLDNASYRLFNGTSAASPYAAGVVALYLEANPEASPGDVLSAIVANSTPDAVTEVPYGTNNLLYSLWQPVEFTPPNKWDFNLTAVGGKVRGRQVIDLRWNPVDLWLEIYRNGLQVANAEPGTGFFRDNTGNNGNDGTYVHQVCATEHFYIPDCSEKVTTIIGAGDDGGGGEESNSPPSADFTYQADKLTVQFTDTSTDSDGTITGWNWNFGDGNSSNDKDPLHTFFGAGAYTVSLTVTDNDGDTGSTSKSISVSDDEISPGDIVLNANGYKQRGRIIIDLSWSGATSSTFDIYRDGVLLAPGITDSGTYSDHTGQNGGGTFTHKVCEAGTQTCSNVTTTTL